jgi:hypothetical protein
MRLRMLRTKIKAENAKSELIKRILMFPCGVSEDTELKIRLFDCHLIRLSGNAIPTMNYTKNL